MSEVKVEKKEKKELKGLKKMRAGICGPKPTVHCDNCKCDRYNECYCVRVKKD